jgi:hypothetical protein
MRKFAVAAAAMAALILGTEGLAWDYSRDAYDQRGQPNYRYRGISGMEYQYDLSRPLDQLRYQNDIRAQMRDELNLGPRIEMDRDFDQWGGGAKRW